MIILSKNIDYTELQNKLVITKNINGKLIDDIYNNNINDRLLKLIPREYIESTIDYYYIGEHFLRAWTNLLREWFFVGIRKDISTYIYWARVKKHPKYIKIGITYDIVKRASFENNKYYDYHVIRVCSNRYQAAYVEYKVRTLYCNRSSEMIDIEKFSDVIDYIRKFHWNNNMYEELSNLGWRFEK